MASRGYSDMETSGESQRQEVVRVFGRFCYCYALAHGMESIRESEDVYLFKRKSGKRFKLLLYEVAWNGQEPLWNLGSLGINDMDDTTVPVAALNQSKGAMTSSQLIEKLRFAMACLSPRP